MHTGDVALEPVRSDRYREAMVVYVEASGQPLGCGSVALWVSGVTRHGSIWFVRLELVRSQGIWLHH